MKAFQYNKPTRQMLYIVCVAIVLVLGFSMILSREYAKEAMFDVETIATSKMEHIVQNASVTLEYLQIYGESMFQDPVVNAWLVSANNGPLDDFNAYNAVRRYQSLQPFIANVYLIHTKTERVINADFGATNFDEFADPSMLAVVKSSTDKYVKFGTHEFEDSRYLTLVIPQAASQTGFLVVLFDRDALETFIFKEAGTDGFSIQIRSDSHRLVMGSESGFEGIALPETAGAGNASNGAFRAIETGDSSRRIVAAELDAIRWTAYFVMDPADLTRNIVAFQRKITILCLGLGAMLLALMMWGSLRSLQPFRHLAGEFRRHLGVQSGSGSTEDADILRHGFEHLLASVEKINASLRNYRVIAKEEYLRQWILQGTENNLRSALTELGVLPRLSRFCIAAFRIESYKAFSEKYNYPSRKLLKYAMGNIANEVAKTEGFESEVVDMDGDHFVFLFASKKETSTSADEKLLLDVQASILEWLRVSTAVAMSNVLQSGDQLRKAYEETYELTLLKYLTGEAKVYTESDLESSYEKTSAFPDDSIVNDLITAVKLGDPLRVDALLENLTVELRRLPYEELRFQLRLIVYALFKTFSKVMDLQELSGTEALLNRFSSLPETAEWLKAQLHAVINLQKLKPEGNRKLEISQEIIEYIHNHLQDPTLSLDSVSDHLGLSTSYVRHVFKEVHGETLAEYILSERIRKVKTLLASTALPIGEIAESAGFLTKSHFYGAFKKSEGMTPLQYRNLETKP